MAGAGSVQKSAIEINQEELARLLAPIALYPDSLLVQMFMAATYPLDVVEASRFMRDNPDLKGDELDKQLLDKQWDVSVKSLCHFPKVLGIMDKNLKATKKLGEYFLADQKTVMDAVQKLRAKAREQGNLESTKEQKVVEKEKTIIIEPAEPEVVYVPTYNATVVYGSWWYSHPPYAWYPPPPAHRALIFTAGVVVGASIYRWCHADWYRGRIDVNINRTANFNRNINASGPANGVSTWRHTPRRPVSQQQLQNVRQNVRQMSPQQRQEARQPGASFFQGTRWPGKKRRAVSSGAMMRTTGLN